MKHKPLFRVKGRRAIKTLRLSDREHTKAAVLKA
jgi:hypothetical protein